MNTSCTASSENKPRCETWLHTGCDMSLAFSQRHTRSCTRLDASGRSTGMYVHEQSAGSSYCSSPHAQIQLRNRSVSKRSVFGPFWYQAITPRFHARAVTGWRVAESDALRRIKDLALRLEGGVASTVWARGRCVYYRHACGWLSNCIPRRLRLEDSE